MKHFVKHFDKHFGFIIFFIWLLFGVFALLLSSCSITHDTTVQGKTTVITTDTTVIYHSGKGNLTVRTPV